MELKICMALLQSSLGYALLAFMLIVAIHAEQSSDTPEIRSVRLQMNSTSTSGSNSNNTSSTGDCNGNGQLYDQGCVCNNGFGGTNCSKSLPVLASASLNVGQTSGTFAVSDQSGNSLLSLDVPTGALQSAISLSVTVYNSSQELPPQVLGSEGSTSTFFAGDVVSISDTSFSQSVRLALRLANDTVLASGTEAHSVFLMFKNSTTGVWERPSLSAVSETSASDEVVTVSGARFVRANTTHFSQWAPVVVTYSVQAPSSPPSTASPVEEDDGRKLLNMSYAAGVAVITGICVIACIFFVCCRQRQIERAKQRYLRQHYIYRSKSISVSQSAKPATFATLSPPTSPNADSGSERERDIHYFEEPELDGGKFRRSMSTRAKTDRPIRRSVNGNSKDGNRSLEQKSSSHRSRSKSNRREREHSNRRERGKFLEDAPGRSESNGGYRMSPTLQLNSEDSVGLDRSIADGDLGYGDSYRTSRLTRSASSMLPDPSVWEDENHSGVRNAQDGGLSSSNFSRSNNGGLTRSQSRLGSQVLPDADSLVSEEDDAPRLL